MNTPNRASDLEGTPLVVRVVAGTHPINMFVIRRYTLNRANGLIAGTDPINMFVIHRYTLNRVNGPVETPLVIRVTP